MSVDLNSSLELSEILDKTALPDQDRRAV